jgi:ubiquinone/menaquinone biosynthesis C-methylase UbiE
LGFDFAPKMIQRGKKTFPHLKLEALEASGKIPLQNDACDAAIMSTILCCMIDKHEQIKLMEEILRILKCGGVLYLSDFLLCGHPRYADKYQEGYKSHKEWGIYTTSEGITVRHHTTQWIMHLLEELNVHWFEQFDFRTMNNNVARTFHCIAQKFNVHIPNVNQKSDKP